MDLINIIPDMTSDTAPSGVVSASAFPTDAYRPFKAMDRDYLTLWKSNSQIPAWLQYKFQTAEKCVGYYIHIRTDAYITYMPNTWTLKASNTGAFTGEEVTLDTQSGITWGPELFKTFLFTNTTPYLYYRINMTAANGATELFIPTLELLAYTPAQASLTAVVTASANSSALLTSANMTASVLVIESEPNEASMFVSTSITATNRRINKANITALAIATSEAQRKSYSYSFVFVGEMQLVNTIQTFIFVQEIEQLPTAKIITRVNA